MASKDETWYKHFTAVTLASFFIVVGIPIWWRTTAVYRSDLPYQEIQSAAAQKPVVRFDFEVIPTILNSPIAFAEFGEVLQQEFRALNMRKNPVQVRFEGSLREANQDEVELITNIKSNKDLEKFPSLPQRTVKYQFYILSPSDTAGVKLPYVNNHRQVFLSSKPDDLVQKALADIVKISQELSSYDTLSNIYGEYRGYSMNDKELLRSFKFDSTYNLVFTLLIPNPTRQYQLDGWDMQAAFDDDAPGFLESLKSYVDVNVKSQVLYYEGLSTTVMKDKSGNHYYLPLDSLPHLINPIEARLGSFVDTDQALNLVIYMPQDVECPLHFHDNADKIVSDRGFLVPRWGSFMLYKCNSTDSAIDTNYILSVFQPQIKSLLGLSTLSTLNKLEEAGDGRIATWELDNWMRKRTVENIARSSVALASLSRLVQRIRNMVINDDIAKQVSVAVTALSESQQFLSRGMISSAFEASKTALTSAESAFFDPSLLELLYFPEDQKFAIYIPLFLPIGLPILGSLVAAIKWYRSKDELPSKKQQ